MHRSRLVGRLMLVSQDLSPIAQVGVGQKGSLFGQSGCGVGNGFVVCVCVSLFKRAKEHSGLEHLKYIVDRFIS